MRYFLFIFLFSSQLFSFSLHERFKKATPGDFVVLAHQKQLMLLLVVEQKDNKLVIEEITGPNTIQKTYGNDWKKWLSEGALEHTSWDKTTLDLEKQSTLSKDLAFLSTLLYLPLEQVLEKDRKRAGPEPASGEMDFRYLWQPKIVVEGKEESVTTTVWKTIWPEDTSDLSGRHVLIYLAADPALPYFPYWTEVKGALGSVKIRVIDSGKSLTYGKTANATDCS